MALSTLAIKNMALDEVPAQRIQSEDEASIEAEACLAHYQPSLELLLEDFDWGFAVRRETLAAVANDRANEWAFAYRLPSDLARPRVLLPFGATDTGDYSSAGQLRGFEAAVQFRIAGENIYTDRETAILEYISSAPEPSTFTAKFTRALALEIASRIVMPIKKERQRQGDLIKAAEVARERAKVDEMNRDRESPRDFIGETQLARMGVLRWQ